MSVYKRPGAQSYSYDFRVKGHRFSGDTERKTKREAEAVERDERVKSRALVAEGVALNKPETWELASSRYWLEVGQHHVNADTTLKSLDWLTRHIGKLTRLRDIDDNRIAALVLRRRSETRQVGSVATRKAASQVSAATVNRTMTEPLRKVILRAERVWGVRTAIIHWRSHFLAEPRERVREASISEEAAILGKLERGYDEAVQFAMRDGCRDAEICGLLWERVDFFGRRYTVIGKGAKARTIPMSEATYQQFKRLLGQHSKFVFTFVALKTRPVLEQIRGKRYPIKPNVFSKVVKAAAVEAGISDFRLHDTRHTAATRTLRVSNLKVVQQLLGHEDISTTTKYAHAVDDDLRAALDAANNATKNATAPKGPVAQEPDSKESSG
jgi:integrase